MSHPLPIRRTIQRYTTLPLPSYRFVPGQAPHPRKHPQGHSYQQPEPTWPAFTAETWAESTGYLYGIDLFNATLWWESHEHWESLWIAVGKTTQPGILLRGLIQLSAAHLRSYMGTTQGSQRLFSRAQEHLLSLPDPYCGLQLHIVLEESYQYLHKQRTGPTLLRLIGF